MAADGAILGRVDGVVDHSSPSDAGHLCLLRAADRDQVNVAVHRSQEIALGFRQRAVQGGDHRRRQTAYRTEKDSGQP